MRDVPSEVKDEEYMFRWGHYQIYCISCYIFIFLLFPTSSTSSCYPSITFLLVLPSFPSWPCCRSDSIIVVVVAAAVVVPY
jgi:hypothetical protein